MDSSLQITAPVEHKTQLESLHVLFVCTYVTKRDARKMWDLALRWNLQGLQSFDEVVLDSAALFLPKPPAPSAFGLLWTRYPQSPRQSAPTPHLCIQEGRGRAASTAQPLSWTLTGSCWTDSVTKLWPPPASLLAPPLWRKGVCCQNMREKWKTIYFSVWSGKLMVTAAILILHLLIFWFV